MPSLLQKKFFPPLVVFIVIFVGLYLSLALYVASYTKVTADETADTAIILGAKSYKGKRYNPCLLSRVTAATHLYKNQTVTYLIVSGGNDTEDNSNEAVTMQKIAKEKGVPDQAIILEKHATSTYENLLYSQKIMSEKGFTSASIVTEPFHIARARLIAKSLNINATYLAADDSPCWTRWKFASRYFLKEPLAILVYIVTQKIKLSAF